MSLVPDESDALNVVADNAANQKRPPKNYEVIAEVPDKPAIYALCGGRGRHMYVAYVGETANLRTRLRQHLVTHDSGITSGERAVMLNHHAITFVYWWQDPEFKKDVVREAAELIANEQLNPIMRSNNHVSTIARNRVQTDNEFRERMIDKFCIDSPSGILTILKLDDVAGRVDLLEESVSGLERRVAKLEAKQTSRK